MSRAAEVLSPCGSPETLTAAIRCGADAVYLGMGGFNARRHAENFDEAALAQAVADCHRHGIAVHLTLNTLVTESELPDALRVAETACALGVDALIVQDMGLARLIRAAAPDMPLHASTQLSCHTPAGVRELRDCGFSRVVLAREMSRDEIAACAGQGCELEVFVHGALCMSVSGQCLLSAVLGGRSGNRGLCAQPCRLPFAPSGRAKAAADTYALSLRDLSLLPHIRDLMALGVTSFKIEGRMKRPEYVAAATSLVAAAVRGEALDETAWQDLQAVFSRSGFTDGYYTSRRGSAMFGVRRKEDVQAAAPVLGKLRRLYEREQPRVALDGELCVNGGQARLTVRDADGHTATAETACPLPPRAAEPARAEAQLRKTGGTPYHFETLTVRAEEGLPVSALNGLRRDALARLDAARTAPIPVPFLCENIPPIEYKNIPQNQPKRLVRLASVEQWSPALATLTDGWSVPLEQWRNAPPHTAAVELPRGMFGSEKAIAEELKQASAYIPSAVCGNIGALPLVREAGMRAIGGMGLNLTNTQALATYAERGLSSAVLSPELRLSRLPKAFPLPVGLTVYGRLPLMLTRNCPRRCALGAHACAACRPSDGLIDRKGVVFPTMCRGGCAELLNSAPLYWADRREELPPVDFWMLYFTTETAAEVAEIARAYRDGGEPRDGITRGLYRRGVD